MLDRVGKESLEDFFVEARGQFSLLSVYWFVFSTETNMTMAKGEAPEILAIRLNRNYITETVAGNLQWFANKLGEKGFIGIDEAGGILGTSGITLADKAGQLLKSVSIKLKNPKKRKYWFDTFVTIFEEEAAYEDLVDMLKTSYEGCKYLSECVDYCSLFLVAVCVWM